MMTATRCQLCDNQMTDLNGYAMCPHCDSPCHPDHKSWCRPADTPCDCCVRCAEARNRVPGGIA